MSSRKLDTEKIAKSLGVSETISVKGDSTETYLNRMSLVRARDILNTRCISYSEDEYGIVEEPTVRELVLQLWAWCEVAGETIPSALKKMDSDELDGTILKSQISSILFLLGEKP